MKSIFLVLSLFFFAETSAQELINQYDENGKRHGLWKKTFEKNPDQVRYEGSFNHGKETGLFKFYQLGQEKPVATKFFPADSDTAEVKYYTQKGNIISEGKMLGEKRIGEWKYYHKDSDDLMMSEHYENGLLNGERIIYFDNGNPTEKSFYKDGKLDGEQLIYSEKGVLLKKFTYKDSLLHGPSKVYNGKGELLIEGQYKNNKHHGIWKYYENGTLKEEKNFSSKKKR